MQNWMNGIAIAVGISGGIWVLGRWLPGVIVKKIHNAFAWAKASAWFRQPDKPKRFNLIIALAEFLEDEIPEPGTGAALYAALGARIAASTPLLLGTAGKWAKALEKAGDAIDTELDEEIKALAAPIAAPPPNA